MARDLLESLAIQEGNAVEASTQPQDSNTHQEHGIQDDAPDYEHQEDNWANASHGETNLY